MGGSSSKSDTEEYPGKKVHEYIRLGDLSGLQAYVSGTNQEDVYSYVNRPDNEDGMTPLARAVAKGDPDIVEYLLSVGSDYTKTGIGLKTKRLAPLPLVIAIVAKNEKIVDILLKYGADPNTPTNLPGRGKTVIELARNISVGESILSKLQDAGESKCDAKEISQRITSLLPRGISANSKNADDYLLQLKYIGDKISHLESSLEKQEYLDPQTGGRKRKRAKRMPKKF